MSDVAIRVEGLGKRYRLGGKLPKDVGVGQRLIQPLARLHRLACGSPTPNGNGMFWALQDVSFEVKHGEVLGVIGRNGSGKSTLLKILSRITEPTRGRAELHGQPSSLLEVGTGFHPELTGRENIYMNGAILGMRKSEIDRKLDEIIAFSEIERFIDTPVKHYSSGMYVRLAFAVAAHLEPDILLVDEVLAVGDAGFQKKCLGKMRDVAEQGRTILFVSHNMTAVATLTHRCLALRQGLVTKIGTPEEVIRHYMMEFFDGVPEQGGVDLRNVPREAKHNPRTAKAIFVKACCRDLSGQARTTFMEGDPLSLEIDFLVRAQINAVEIHSSIQTMMDIRVCAMLSDVMEVSLQPGLYRAAVQLNPNYLRPGDYYAGLGLYTPSVQDGVKQAIRFVIEPSSKAENNVNWSYQNLGVVRIPYEWKRPEPVRQDLEKGA